MYKGWEQTVLHQLVLVALLSRQAAQLGRLSLARPAQEHVCERQGRTLQEHTHVSGHCNCAMHAQQHRVNLIHTYDMHGCHMGVSWSERHAVTVTVVWCGDCGVGLSG